MVYLNNNYERKAEIVQEALKFLSLPFALVVADIRIILESEKDTSTLEGTISVALSKLAEGNIKKPEQLYFIFLTEYYRSLSTK
ncbi:hypothetical protein [Mesobacillus jeotgali]|uniref:hypothetical protein n=1 Tax=Mesobacillus jeotgali TaxID=129985 RepID=UPI000C850088|nr:hypothetical protein [Mesobacillus jeotgali]